MNGARSVAVTALRAYLDAFQVAWSEPEWQQAITGLAEAQAVKAGAVFLLLRVAVTGTDQTPPLYPIMRLLGEAEVRRRLETALTALA
jgi:glutamyl/glutaminyl-tRNA synthetase